MRKRRKNRGTVLTLCLLILLFCGSFFGFWMWQKQDDPVSSVQTQAHIEADVTDGIRWNGGIYRYNDHLSNYLFIGVDKDELSESSSGKLQAGAGDALFLVSYDRVSKDVAVISIPRDTMTDIEVILPDGSSAGKIKDHISLSYGYGDGKHESCYLTRDAVSNLFYGIPINGYCAVSMDGLSEIPRTIGSFDVVVPNDSLTAEYPMYTQGSTVTITEETVETFVRYRDIHVANSALARQERQIAFLEAALSCVENRFAQDAGVVTDLYENLTDYMVTNMGNDLFVDLFEAVCSDAVLRSLDLPGEAVSGSGYDEFQVSDADLYDLVMEVFYVEAGA